MRIFALAGIFLTVATAFTPLADAQDCTANAAGIAKGSGLAAVMDRDDRIWLTAPTSLEQKTGLLERIAPIVLYPVIPTDLGDAETTYSSPAISLVRFDTVTGIDHDFGSNGVVTDAMGSRNSRYAANLTNIVFDNKGRLVIGGWKQRDWALAGPAHEMIARRYLPNGKPDIGFARKGFLKDRIDWKQGKTESIAIDSDNRLVVAATEHAAEYNFASSLLLLRYQENGYPDRSFGKKGLVKPGVIYGADQTMIAAIDSEGRYLVAGATPSAKHQMFSGSTLALPSKPGLQIARFTPDGNIDPSFNLTSHVLENAEGQSVNTIGLYLDQQGRIVHAASYVDQQGLRHYAIIRRTPSGEPDVTFGNSGVITAQITKHRREWLYSATIELDAKDRVILSVTHGMHYGTNQNHQSHIVRYTTEGIADDSFGNEGGINLPDVSALNLAFDSSSRLYAIGNRYGCTNIMRYTQDGKPDESFGQTTPGE